MSLKRKRSASAGSEGVPLGARRRAAPYPSPASRGSKAIMSANTHYMKRKVFLGTSTLAAGVDENFLAFPFTLADLPNVSELSALYDQYKLIQVEMQFVPSTTLSFQGTPYDCNTTMFLLNDFDDDVVPTSLDTLLQSGRTHMTQLTRNGSSVKWSVKPRVTGAVASGSGAGAVVNTKAVWLDMGSTTTKHFGTKIAIRRLNQTGLAANNPSFAFDTYATYHVLLKNPR